MAALFLIPFIAAFFLTIVMRPEVIPDDLPPLPVVQAMATIALLAVNFAIAVSGLALAQGTSCQTGRIFFALPSFIAIASLLTAVVLLLPRRKGAKGQAELPYALGDAIAFFDQLSASADRLGIRRVDCALIDDHGPGLEVAGDRMRGVTVFVRRWLVDALRGPLTPDARASAPLLVRFAVQHEICHALNGDHYLYRVARAVAYAQLWWLAGGAALILLIASPWPCSAPAPLSLWLAEAFGLIATVCALHRRLAKAFVLRYEIRADSRALAMLSPAERDELLAIRKFATGAGATRFARFLAFLECRRPASRAPFMSRLLRLVWPAPPEVSTRLSGQPGLETRRDEQWALFGGLSAGVVLMSIVAAFHPMLEGATTMWAALAVAIPIPNAYFVVRSRRAVLTSDAGQAHLTPRIMTALGFLAGVIISTILTIFFFIAPLAARPTAVTSMGGLIVFEFLICAAVTIVCLMTTTGGNNLTTAVETSFASWMALIPVLFGCALAAPPVGMVLAGRQKLWVTTIAAAGPAMLAALAGFSTSQIVWRAKSSLHSLAPFAVLDGFFPVFRYRLFWWNVDVDAARHSRIGSLALASGIVGIMFAVPALVAVAGAKLVFPGRAFEALFVGSLLYLTALAILPVGGEAKKQPPMSDDLLRAMARLLRLADLDPSIASSGMEYLRTRMRDALRRNFVQPPPGDETSTPADIRRAVTFAELARSSGADELIVEWQPRFAQLLGRFSDGDGVVSWRDGPPSLMFTAWAYRLARLANLAPAEAMERRLAAIESMAIEAAREDYPSIAETALVAGILREEHRLDRDLAEAWSRLVSLDSVRPLQSIIDLYEIAAAVDREPLMVRLRAITRSKLWETLQLNTVSEMDRLLDLYETALRLPLEDDRLLEIARRAIREIAQAPEPLTG